MRASARKGASVVVELLDVVVGVAPGGLGPLLAPLVGRDALCEVVVGLSDGRARRAQGGVAGSVDGRRGKHSKPRAREKRRTLIVWAVMNLLQPETGHSLAAPSRYWMMVAREYEWGQTVLRCVASPSGQEGGRQSVGRGTEGGAKGTHEV